jgi:hypothetical protein
VSRAGCRAMVTALLVLICGACGGSSSSAHGGKTSATKDTAAALSVTLPRLADLQRIEDVGSTKPTITQDRATPEGPLTAAGVLTVLDHHGAYDSAFRAAGGGAGAHERFDVPSDPRQWDALAVKFSGGEQAQRFANAVSATLQRAGGQPMHLEYTRDAASRAVFKIPSSSPLGVPGHEAYMTDLVYPDGSYYMFTLVVPAGNGGNVILDEFAGSVIGQRNNCGNNLANC